MNLFLFQKELIQYTLVMEEGDLQTKFPAGELVVRVVSKISSIFSLSVK